MSHHDDNNGGLIDCHGSSKALRLLQSLTKTPAGKVLYQQIERILRDADHTQDKIIRGYTALVLTMIESYRRKLPKESLLYLELKLIQKRLIPPISISELATLQSYIKNASRLINELSDVDGDVIKDALSPLLAKSSSIDTLTELFEEPENHNVWSEQQVDSLYRQKLDQQHREFDALQKQLSEKLNDSSRQYDEFSRSLQSIYRELEKSNKEIDIKTLKTTTMQEIRQLLDQQDNLSAVINESRQLLDKVSQHSQRLSMELNQVRVLSLTDDLTHLPNRRAFLRRLEDEINRSQRENAPLILGILDLDYFKDINDKYGHHVGDEILKSYSTDILSVFRHYDMVARYGGEEFAVILPNTDHDGAIRAFNKVKDKAAGHYLRHNDTHIALPSFSAGLAKHRPGESSKEFIERVDGLLYKAKHAGRNKIEIEQSLIQEKGPEENPLTEN